MSDTMAIFQGEADCKLGFLIDGEWSRVLKTWPSVEEVRAFLRSAADWYQGKYGESLGWDVDKIPVIALQKGNP